MKVTFVAHASILIETNRVTILSDPWWKGPCFGAQWWVYPEPALSALEGKTVDYIYISHGHHDHFHPGTLRTFPRTVKVLVAKGFDIAPPLRQMGFEVIEVPVDEELNLDNNVKVRIEPTCNDDSLMAVTDGLETCLNLNDALHAAPASVQDKFIPRLRGLYPQGIDYLFCGYGIASHFPNCYKIPGKNRAVSVGTRQKYFNRNWAKIVNGLSPRFAFPFAADVVLLEEDLFWANEPTHNTERPLEALRLQYPRCFVNAMDIAPGFTIQDGAVQVDKRRQPVSSESLSQNMKGEIEKANRLPAVTADQVGELADLLRTNIAMIEDYLKSYPGNYDCLICIRAASKGIHISKKGETFAVSVTENLSPAAYDVSYTTRFPYLKNSLVTAYGKEVLFVGSGGIFEYRNRRLVRKKIHRELMQIVARQAGSPRPRYGGSSRLVYAAKHAVKEILGLNLQDLYDLEQWTVYGDTPEAETVGHRAPGE